MDHLINVFKVMSDKTRFRIIVLLKQQKLRVHEICEILDLPQSKVSKHLAKLKDLNFVVGVREEQYMCYELKLIDPILCDLVEEIIKNIEKYPELAMDRKNLADKKNLIF